MLTVTKTVDGFGVYSEIIEEFEEGDEIVLSLSSNCCSEETISETFVSVTPEQPLYLETEWTDVEGVYQFKLIHTSGETVVSQKVCYFNNMDLACRVGEAILADCTSDVHLDYFILLGMQNCPCDCENMCILYKRILKKLDEEFCCDEITGQPCQTC